MPMVGLQSPEVQGIQAIGKVLKLSRQRKFFLLVSIYQTFDRLRGIAKQNQKRSAKPLASGNGPHKRPLPKIKLGRKVFCRTISGNHSGVPAGSPPGSEKKRAPEGARERPLGGETQLYAD